MLCVSLSLICSVGVLVVLTSGNCRLPCRSDVRHYCFTCLCVFVLACLIVCSVQTLWLLFNPKISTASCLNLNCLLE